jgi:hypothetical protein
VEWQGTIVIAVHDMPAICASGNGDDGLEVSNFIDC